MNILFFGDVIGRVGREGLAVVLPKWRQSEKIDLVIVNAENAAHGKGLTPRVAEELWALDIDVLTMGNHTFDRKEIMSIIDDPRLLRPANLPAGVLGSGSGTYKSKSGVSVGVLQVMGRVNMPLSDCPFKAADREIEKLKKSTPVIFVDIHAEATSEKSAMGWYLDGRVSAVVGTHTHIQTADERVLPKGTAFLSDAGACGPLNSVIGMTIDDAVKRFTSGQHVPFSVAPGDAQVCGCLVDIEESTGQARSIKRIRETVRIAASLQENR